MSDDFTHLNLRGWPFSVVPSEESAEIWIGRPEFERRLRSILRTARRVDASRIVLFWAAFGAGKTHALRHLGFLAREDDRVTALYVVTPKSIRSFLDVYRAIVVSGLADGLLDDLGLALHRRYGPAGGATELQRALIRLVAFDEPQSRPVLAWLKAEKVGMRELNEVGLRTRLETGADAVEALDELIDLLRSELGTRLVLMLDEIQELGELDRRRLDEAVGGLHKVFDRNTEGLTMVLAFTTGSQQTVARIIGETLYERRSEILTLPGLTAEEGVDFIRGLIEAWSIDHDRAPFPFEREAIDAVVKRVARDQSDLTPRELIRAFDAILREVDIDIDEGSMTMVDSRYALEKLAHTDGDGEAP